MLISSLGTVECYALDNAREQLAVSLGVAAMGRIIPHTPGVWRARVVGESDGSKPSGCPPWAQRDISLPVTQSGQGIEISLERNVSSYTAPGTCQ